ncbi:DUF6221 family protein [Nonomuraea sp. NPDC050663]|uniref:DUF6221 family protein n=1 Tax=Nonomuraea sp. NPDC050663 TaxID=3364370 RepID=UPI0037B590C9
MSDLVGFLRDQLDEEERDAGLAMAALLPARMLTGGEQVTVPVERVLRQLPKELAQHIARHDPPAVLADVASRRQILADHRMTQAEAVTEDDSLFWEECRECGGEWPCRTVRRLAARYERLPGFKDEWR